MSLLPRAKVTNFPLAVPAFCVLNFGEDTYRTNTVKKTANPVWDEECSLVVKKTQLSYNVSFQVFARNKFKTKNVLLGRGVLPVSALLVPRNEINVLLCNEPKASKEERKALKKKTKETVFWDGVAGNVVGAVRIVSSFVDVSEALSQFWYDLSVSYAIENSSRGLTAADFCDLLLCLGNAFGESDYMALRRTYALDKVDVIPFDAIPDIINRLILDKTIHVTRCPNCGAEVSQGEPSLRHILYCMDNTARIEEDEIIAGVLSGGEDNSNSNSHSLTPSLPSEPSSHNSELLSSRSRLSSVRAPVVTDKAVGQNSFRILCLNRSTGDLEEEDVVGWAKWSIGGLYRTRIGRASSDRQRVRKMMQRLSMRMSIKFNSPNSRSLLYSYINRFHIDAGEFADSPDSMTNLNMFFFRRLKAGARPIYAWDDECKAVQPCDARVLVFPTIESATRLWIKGSQFSIVNLVRDPSLASQFEGGSMALVRLAPQDYHRYHVPIDCTIGETVYFDGALLSVSPLAVRKDIDVLTENRRSMTVLHSPIFGKVLFVAIGATVVGSVIDTAKEGQVCRKGDELGHFAFGGSTIILLFRPKAIVFDEDLIAASMKPLETRVRMGTSLGSAVPI